MVTRCGTLMTRSARSEPWDRKRKTMLLCIIVKELCSDEFKYLVTVFSVTYG